MRPFGLPCTAAQRVLLVKFPAHRILGDVGADPGEVIVMRRGEAFAWRELSPFTDLIANASPLPPTRMIP
ncbi:MAG: hypothetical protein A2Z66_02855 [Chloroflexi bacterium RBG_13_66_10]|nr:MAG: hypothetical protein A2Z66_02855 [Chloroflexi bacterium RBG_13_66_10]